MTKLAHIFTLLVLMAAVPRLYGQELVKDIRLGSAPSQPRAMVPVGDHFFFEAWTDENGRELWVSDGTAAGTKMVIDIAPGAESSRAEPLVAIGNILYFNTQNPGAFWKTDGTEVGTEKLVEFWSGSARRAWVVGNIVFFIHHPGNGGLLWYTDGTPSGTRYANEFGAGQPTTDNIGDDLVVFGGSVYFTASQSGLNAAVWKIQPPNMIPEKVLLEIFHPLRLLATPTKLFILNVETREINSLWVSEDPLNEATKVAVFSGRGPSSDARFIGSNNEWVYFNAEDGIHGFEPCVSDGTTSGTQVLRDANPGAGSFFVGESMAFNNDFFFAMPDPVFGQELWKTDGSEDGLSLFKDINLGLGHASVQNLFVTDRGMVFSATDGVHGNELWITTGLSHQTEMISDINPGANSSSPGAFLQLGDYLYFSATQEDTGKELWRLDLSTITTDIDRAPVIPQHYTVSPASPNPFSSVTQLSYDFPPGYVRIDLFNALGQLVMNLYDGYQHARLADVSVNAGGLVSGIYYVRFLTGSFITTRKVVLVR